MARRGRVRWVRWGIAAALLAWAGVAAFLLLQARAEGQRGLDALDAVRQDQTFDALVSPATGTRLGEAADHFRAARRRLSNPLMVPLRFVPVLGRQINSARALNSGAGEVAAIAADGARELRIASTGRPPAGPERVALLRHLASVASRAEGRLADIPAGPGQALVGPLRDARAEFVSTRDEAVDGLASAVTVLSGTAELLDRDHRYLLFGANNAEMRAGSGMFLSAAELRTGDGTLELGAVRPTASLILPDSVPVGGDLARNWPWLPLGEDFRNLALTPQFDVSAPVAARMWEQVPGGRRVDGVAAIDVEGLRAMLRVVGPVTVDGVTYRASTVDRLLLNEQYRTFDDNVQRRDEVGAVAQAVFDRLDTGRFPVKDLADQLVAMVRGRHLLLWSSERDQQAAWAAAGAAGDLTERSLAVSTVNRSATKLDWFLRSRVDVSTKRQGARTSVDLRITLDNSTPDGEPRYVAGPNVAGLAKGEWSGVVVVNVPGSARGTVVKGGAYETLRGNDGPTSVVGRYLRVKAGQRAVIDVSFVVSSQIDRFVLEPSGRIPRTVWSWNGSTFRTEVRRSVAL